MAVTKRNPIQPIRGIGGIVAGLVLMSGAVQAADFGGPAPVVKAPVVVGPAFTFTTSAYLWATGLEGRLRTLPPFPAANVNIGFDQVMKNFDGGLMGTAEMRYGRYIGFFDFMASKISPGKAINAAGYPGIRYGMQSFVILPEQTYGIPIEEKLLPQLLKEAGYATSIIGKWHLGHADRKLWPRQRGFDYQYGALIGEVDYYTHDVHGTKDWYRDNRVRNEQGYATTLFGRDAVRYIEAHDPKKPMFMYLAFNAPHTPLQAPKEYIDRFKSIPDENRRTYAAMIAAMDDQIGNVLAALKKKGMRDNTLIMFHSDNGGVRSAAFAGQIATKGEPPASNKPFRDGKGSLYEGGTRVVAFANWPGKIKAQKVSGMMHIVDMLPTLTGLAGATTNGTQPLDGLNVWKTIAEGAPSPRNEIVYNVEMFRGAVRQGDWKLVTRSTLPTKLELFNLAQDPSEAKDLSAENPQIVATLQKRIDTLAKEMKPSMFFAQTFKAYMGRHAPAPVFPNDDAYFTSVD